MKGRYSIYGNSIGGGIKWGNGIGGKEGVWRIEVKAVNEDLNYCKGTVWIIYV